MIQAEKDVSLCEDKVSTARGDHANAKSEADANNVEETQAKELLDRCELDYDLVQANLSLCESRITVLKNGLQLDKTITGHVTTAAAIVAGVFGGPEAAKTADETGKKVTEKHAEGQETELARLEKELEELKKALESRRQALKDARSEYIQKKALGVKLKGKVDVAALALDGANKRLEGANNIVRITATRETQSQEVIDHILIKQTTLSEKISSQELKVAISDSEVKDLEKMKSLLEASKETVAKAVVDTDAKVKELRDKISLAEKAVSSATATVKEHSSAMELYKNVQASPSKLDAMKRSLARAQIAKRNKGATIKAVQMEIAQLRSTHESMKEKLAPHKEVATKRKIKANKD